MISFQAQKMLKPGELSGRSSFKLCYNCLVIKLGKTKIKPKEAGYFLLGITLTGIILWGYQMTRSNLPLSYQPATNIAWLPQTVTHHQKLIDEVAKEYNLHPNLVAIIMTLESGGFTKADSGQAEGLMQITPYTAKDIAEKHLQKPVEKYNIWDQKTNIEFGAAYLTHLRDEFCDPGDNEELCVELIAAGYNAGPGAANRLFKGEGLTEAETVIYSRNAMNFWRERKAATSPTYSRWLGAGGESLIKKAEKEQR